MTVRSKQAAARNQAAAIRARAPIDPHHHDGKQGPQPRFRAFKVTQNVQHPQTGKVLMAPGQLQVGLDHRSITKWAWIEHDKDVRGDGSPVAPHVHIALQCNDGRSCEQIANWFKVPVDLVKPLSGRGAFISYVRYLTHEDPNQQALGKYRYPDNKVVANFNWRSEVDEHFAKALKIPSHLDEVKVAVLQGSLSPWEIREAEPLLYANNSIVLKRLAEDCRIAHVREGLETPALQDMQLRIRAGVNLTDALTWIADQLNLQGDNYDRMLWAGKVVMGTESAVDSPGS